MLQVDDVVLNDAFVLSQSEVLQGEKSGVETLLVELRVVRGETEYGDSAKIWRQSW